MVARAPPFISVVDHVQGRGYSVLIYLISYERRPRSVLWYLYFNGIRVPSNLRLPCIDVRTRSCVITPLIGTSLPQCDLLLWPRSSGPVPSRPHQSTKRVSVHPKGMPRPFPNQDAPSVISNSTYGHNTYQLKI